MNRFKLNGKYEYCPNGNYWQDISGIFDTKIYLFCDCNKCKGKVYELRPIDITKNVSKETIEQARNINKLENIRERINTKNMKKINDILED